MTLKFQFLDILWRLLQLTTESMNTTSRKFIMFFYLANCYSEDTYSSYWVSIEEAIVWESNCLPNRLNCIPTLDRYQYSKWWEICCNVLHIRRWVVMSDLFLSISLNSSSFIETSPMQLAKTCSYNTSHDVEDSTHQGNSESDPNYWQLYLEMVMEASIG